MYKTLDSSDLVSSLHSFFHTHWHLARHDVVDGLLHVDTLEDGLQQLWFNRNNDLNMRSLPLPKLF